MVDKTKHSNDEIFDLLSAMAVDIEEIKKRSGKEISEATDDENPIMRLGKEVMWLRKSVEWFPYIMRKGFQEWKNYQERKDEEWYDLMDNFAKQVNDNNAIGTLHKEEIKRALILIKSLIEGKNKEGIYTNTINITPKADPLIIPKSFKGWLKFLFYDCPRYSFSKPNRRKFLSDLGRTIRLLISIIIIVLLFLLANENGHLRKEIKSLQSFETKL